MKQSTKTVHAATHTASRTVRHAAAPAADVPAVDASTPAEPAPATADPPAPEGLGATATVAPSAPSAGSVGASPVGPSILTMLIAQAARNVNEASAAVTQIQSYLPGLVSLPEAQRKTAGGRFRDGEAQVLITVLQECAARPELVVSLADEDNGVDPTTFETELLISRIQLGLLLTPLSATLLQLASNLDDTVLYLNELTRAPTLEAYAILKAVAKTDLSVKTAITPALDFYASIAQAAANTRKKNAAAKAAAQATQPATAPIVQAGTTGQASAVVGK